MGPNKDTTNIDTEIKEAEEFLSEDQINVIRSIVTIGETSGLPAITEGSESTATSTTANLISDKTSIDNSKWDNLKPTLRSLGLVREIGAESTCVNLNASTEEDTDLDSDDDDDDDDDDDLENDDLDEDEEDLDTNDDDNADHDNDIDLASIQKRRRKFRRKMKRLKRLKLQQKTTATIHIADKSEDVQIISTVNAEQAIIIIDDTASNKVNTDEIKIVEINDTSDRSAVVSSNSESSRQRTSASISKTNESTTNNSDKPTG